MDKVVLVDKNNNKIGIEDKMIAHTKGLLHRAFSILVYNEDREFLLQKRAGEKYHTPNLWTNTCCSHPFDDETYSNAVSRRLYEEMGMSCDLSEAFSFIYKANLTGNLTEHEHDTVFMGQTNQLPVINESEVSEFRYVSFSDLRIEISNHPNQFTPWFKMIINKLDVNFFDLKKYYYA